VRDGAPLGFRTPNGQIWGHSIAEFFWIQRDPRIPGLLTAWSMSMLHYLRERLSPDQRDVLAEDRSHPPRVLQPWPLLCVPNPLADGELETLCIGGDRGCQYPREPGSLPHQLASTPPTPTSGPLDGAGPAGPDDEEFWISRMELKQVLTWGMDPEDIEEDPRFHIPDQSVPSNERLPPKLEEFIPTECLPDILLVHDPYDLAAGTEGDRVDGCVQFEADVPIRYKRKHPGPITVTGGQQTSNVGHIYLSPSNLCGRGNHSFVYYAPLTLPEPLTARTCSGQVTVLAKLSFPGREHLDLLRQEGMIYNAFPKWMMEDYCGLNLMYGIRVSILVVVVVVDYSKNDAQPDKRRLPCLHVLSFRNSMVTTSRRTRLTVT
jgi:hypothetical protein